jgi:thiamine-phosphate pyrophosphorylase
MRPLRGLYAITPGMPGDASRVEAAIVSGALCALQYRDKGGEAARRLREAQRLAQLCRAHEVRFIVNDDVELALAVDADGVHLGREDGELAAARARLPGRRIGASCNDQPALAGRAAALGADYVPAAVPRGSRVGSASRVSASGSSPASRATCALVRRLGLYGR